jgi:prepilin-type N-terminal cleavage/methylation domain-containing protein
MRLMRTRRRAFTLVELLVVIAIIAVLMAIALPVFNSAREKGRQTKCMANLHQVGMALRMYLLEEGQYPGPYDPITGQGGMNSLYPTYITSRQQLVCPDDSVQDIAAYKALTGPNNVTFATLISNSVVNYLWDSAVTLPSTSTYTGARGPQFFTEMYSSYNAYYNYMGYVPKDGTYTVLGFNLPTAKTAWSTGDNIAFYYEWYRWDPENLLGYTTTPTNYNLVDQYLQFDLARQVYWYDFPNNADTGTYRLRDGLGRPLWDVDDTGYYTNYGIPSAVFPGLINRNAPDNTIVTRCPNHHPFKAQKLANGKTTYSDIVLRLDGSVGWVSIAGANYNWAIQSAQTH